MLQVAAGWGLFVLTLLSAPSLGGGLSLRAQPCPAKIPTIPTILPLAAPAVVLPGPGPTLAPLGSLPHMSDSLLPTLTGHAAQPAAMPPAPTKAPVDYTVEKVPKRRIEPARKPWGEKYVADPNSPGHWIRSSPIVPPQFNASQWEQDAKDGDYIPIWKVNGVTYDAETEAKLVEFAAAKQEGDKGRVEALRSELLSEGILADIVTSPVVTPSQPGAKYDTETEAILKKFAAAKRDQDYASADILRRDLRAKGIDADLVTATRLQSDAGAAGKVVHVTYDPLTEAILEKFAAAKKNQDHAATGTLREELRAQGIDADVVATMRALGAL